MIPLISIRWSYIRSIVIRSKSLLFARSYIFTFQRGSTPSWGASASRRWSFFHGSWTGCCTTTVTCRDVLLQVTVLTMIRVIAIRVWWRRLLFSNQICNKKKKITSNFLILEFLIKQVLKTCLTRTLLRDRRLIIDDRSNLLHRWRESLCFL